MLEHGLIFLISLTCADIHKNYNIHEDACNKTILASSHKVELVQSVNKTDKIIEAKIKPTDKTKATIYTVLLVGAKAAKDKKLNYAFNSKRFVNRINVSATPNSGSVGLTWDLP